MGLANGKDDKNILRSNSCVNFDPCHVSVQFFWPLLFATHRVALGSKCLSPGAPGKGRCVPLRGGRIALIPFLAVCRFLFPFGLDDLRIDPVAQLSPAGAPCFCFGCPGVPSESIQQKKSQAHRNLIMLGAITHFYQEFLWV